MSAAEIRQKLGSLADAEQAAILQRFFKTGKGEYGEGDVFLGIKMGQLHQIARQNKHLAMDQVEQILTSQIHEHRMVALLILVYRYPKADTAEQKDIYEFIIEHTDYVNNWDLVDVTIPKTVGYYLRDHRPERKILYKLAGSDNIWERRIAVMSTFSFIREGDYSDTLEIAELLLQDEHDLIHKAVGWMLREIGKKDQKVEEGFLDNYYREMPRTMLRYAIEKFPDARRKHYLKK